MRLTAALPAGIVLLAVLAGCAQNGPQKSGGSGGAPASGFHFGNVTTVDDGTTGVSEPSILVDPSDAIWIAGPTGFVTPATQHNPQPYTHDTALFVSRDHGATWTNVQQIPMYGRDACPGGGDSDIAASPDGALYLIDLNLENVPIDVSTDGGKTWLFNCSTSVLPGVDRQWVAATDQHVWISVNHDVSGTQADQGAIVYRADKMGLPTDGLVFGPPVRVPFGGAIVVDQKTGILYTAGQGNIVMVSADAGDTWNADPTGLAGKDLSTSFVSIALDAKGNVFVAGAGHDGVVVSGSRDHGKTWTPAAAFKPYAWGDKKSTSADARYGFAWVAAGGNGTVDFAWYGRPSRNETGPWTTPEKGYYVFAGQSADVLSAGAAATATYARVTDTPITTKELCQGIVLANPNDPTTPPPLTPCDVQDPSKTRELGDFFEASVDNTGHFVITFDDANGHSPPLLKFARQTDGLLAPPDAYAKGK